MNGEEAIIGAIKCSGSQHGWKIRKRAGAIWLQGMTEKAGERYRCSARWQVVEKTGSLEFNLPS